MFIRTDICRLRADNKLLYFEVGSEGVESVVTSLAFVEMSASDEVIVL